jgi:rare lipoprotein A
VAVFMTARVGRVSFAMTCVVLSGCSGGTERRADYRQPNRPPAATTQVDPRYGTSPSPRLVTDAAPVPKGGGGYKIGSPYKISGRWYYPAEDRNYDRTGVASWYGTDFHGRKTANGEIFDMNALTAAHPTLPLPSYAYVTNLANGRTILVRINDRGPYVHDRLIDLSRQSARALGTEASGTGRVQVKYAGRAPLDGNPQHERQFLAQQPWSQQPSAPSPVGRMSLGAAAQ